MMNKPSASMEKHGIFEDEESINNSEGFKRDLVFLIQLDVDNISTI